MSDYDIYVFILCFIVFLIFVPLFTYMITLITRQKLKLIKNGLEDEEIIKEYEKNKNKSRVWNVISMTFSLLVCVALVAMFIFSVFLRSAENKAPNGIPSLKVVKTDSMSSKHEKNTYLTENGLDDQIQTFDIIVTHHLPPEEELELYDIVVYEQEGFYIIHRIVGIEEPNEAHPQERHFLLQGDANDRPDRFPVLYEQMLGIYKGERVPFVGSFILFLQHPAGWLCILLIVFTMIATPIIEKKVRRESLIRLKMLGKESEQKEEKMTV